jgi:hypothetical protein
MKWEPSVGPSARVAFGVMKNKEDAYFLHSKFKTLMKQGLANSKLKICNNQLKHHRL